jgi:hypothetical protein
VGFFVDLVGGGERVKCGKRKKLKFSEKTYRTTPPSPPQNTQPAVNNHNHNNSTAHLVRRAQQQHVGALHGALEVGLGHDVGACLGFLVLVLAFAYELECGQRFRAQATGVLLAALPPKAQQKANMTAPAAQARTQVDAGQVFGVFARRVDHLGQLAALFRFGV